MHFILCVKEELVTNKVFDIKKFQMEVYGLKTIFIS